MIFLYICNLLPNLNVLVMAADKKTHATNDSLYIYSTYIYINNYLFIVCSYSYYEANDCRLGHAAERVYI